MSSEFFGIIYSTAGFIGLGSVISGLILRRFDRLEKKLDRREKDLIRESVIEGEALNACAKLGEANTLALRAITSDELYENELENLRHSINALDTFMREKSAEYLHSK